MKRVLFLLSHLCSGSGSLFDSLDAHPRIQGFRGGEYENRLSLLALASRDHKLGNASAVYMDELLFNQSIGDKGVYGVCKHVFVLRDPRDALNEIVATKNYTPGGALSHYLFRLRRLRAIARRSLDSVLLTFADLEAGSGGDLIADYLDFDEPVVLGPVAGLGSGNVCERGQVVEATHAFEGTLYALKRLGLRSAS